MSDPSHQRRSPEQWQRLIEQQAASALNQAAFCASQGLAKTTFQHWKRRLRTPASTALSQPPVSAMFAPLGAPDEPPREDEPDSRWTIELDLGEGVCLRFRRGGP